MTKWLLQCRSCGRRRILDVGYDLRKFRQLYLYCPYCRCNTYHDIIGVESEETH